MGSRCTGTITGCRLQLIQPDYQTTALQYGESVYACQWSGTELCSWSRRARRVDCKFGTYYVPYTNTRVMYDYMEPCNPLAGSLPAG